MIQRHCPEQPLKLLHDLRRFVAALIPCLRRFDVASVGKAIGTDGTKLRQTKGLAIIFAYITASGPLGPSGAELDSSCDQHTLPRLHVHLPKPGEEAAENGRENVRRTMHQQV